MTQSLPHVIIFVDIAGSVEFKLDQGVKIANAKISERMADVSGQLKQIDSTIDIRPIEGDGLLATGNDLLAVFQSMVMMQHVWKVFKTGQLPVRVAIGYGEYETALDGSLRGTQIDLTSRILKHCEPGSVVVTDSARPKIFDAGLRYKLIRMEADLKGFGEEAFWKTNGTFQFLDRRAQGAAQQVMLDFKTKVALFATNLVLAACTAIFTAAAIKYIFPS